MFGLIGTHTAHSASPALFQPLLKAHKLPPYQCYSHPSLQAVKKFLQHPPCPLHGLNITFPYKKTIIPLLFALSPLAKRIGAVNTLKKQDQQWWGYNTDYHGFLLAYKKLPQGDWKDKKALILGAGGAAQAVACVLEDLDHPFDVVVRTKTASFAHKTLTYAHLMRHSALLLHYGLIVHATPLGTFPQTQTRVTFPFEALQSSHMLYDLVYRPPQTALMKAFAQQKCRTFNGKSMLVAQAKKSWDIWMKKPTHSSNSSELLYLRENEDENKTKKDP